MADLINFHDPLLLSSPDQGVRALLQANVALSEHGLSLSAQDARQIVEHRGEVLRSAARVEFSYAPLTMIAEALCASPYVSRSDFVETLNALVDLFYEAKNDTLESVGDEELIAFLIDRFDNVCKGSLDLLEGRELFELGQSCRRSAVWDESEEQEEDSDGEEDF